MISGVVVARVLGPEARGQLAAVTVPAFTVMAVALFSLDEALTRKVALHQVGPVRAKQISLLWSIRGGIPVAILIVAIQLTFIISGSVPVEAIAIAALAPVFFLQRMISGILNGVGKIAAWNVSRSAGGFIYTALIAGLYLGNLITLRSAVFSWVAAYGLCLVIAIYLLRSEVARAPRPDSTGVLRLRELFTFGWKANLARVSARLNQQGDQVLLAFMVPAHQLGLYAVGATVSLSPGMLIMGYSYYAFAACARVPDSGRLKASYVYIKRGWLFTIAVYLPLIVLVPSIIQVIFGQEYSAAIGVTQILCIAAMFLFGSQATVSVLNANGYPGLAAISQACALLCTVVGLIVLVPFFGIVGAAVTSTVAYLAYASILWLVTKRKFKQLKDASDDEREFSVVEDNPL